ncbi:MAG: hypothetical protein ACI3U8_07720 [Candidatus Onthomonas sp.]
MNTKYNYDHYEEWYLEPRDTGKAPIEYLIQTLGALPEERGDIDRKPEYQRDWAQLKSLPDYHYKTGCYDDPEMVAGLNARGLHYESLEMGATRWLVTAPREAYEQQNRRVPLVVVFHKENYDDPLWNLKTLELYRDYVDAAAEKQDRTLIFIVTNGGPANMFTGMITEGIQNYCADRDQIYIDISNLLRHGKTLSEIEGFQYPDLEGKTVENPDSCIQLLDGIPVLNFSWRWVTPWRAHKIDGASDGTVDREWQIHSETGRKMLLANQLSYHFKSCKDDDIQAYWKQMGLNYGCHYVQDERWIIFTPMETRLEKLPVVVCLDEVNEPDDHKPIAAYFNYREYCDIASQGDCAVIFFAMESPRLNDLICDILQDAARQYPIDLSRVYMTGHSHNGHFTQEFARRHPKVVACIAPLGNSPGLPTPAVSHEAVAVDDARAAIMETMDMPTCIICGCGEVGGMVPICQTAHAFEAGINVEGYAASAEGKMAMWRRRLKAERCPDQTVEEILATANSSNKAVRALGIPTDRAETVYIDGFEHYIADIQNVDGKYHFRVVAIENMPHMTLPSMHLCAWNYMRRFARDTETGEVIELY